MLFHLSVKDNGSHMIGSCDEGCPTTGVPTCLVCGYRTDPDYTNPAFKLRRKSFDISCCYDGTIIVSDRFRALYQSLGGSNMRFDRLPAAPGFYHLKCNRPLLLDYLAMSTERGRSCIGCRRHLDVFGYSHVVLDARAHLPDEELAFSDLYFGSNNEASPLMVCGEALAETLRCAGLSGIDSYNPVEQPRSAG